MSALIKIRRLFLNWKKKEDGSTAMEFSILVVPYVMIVMGIIELSLMYTSASLLEGATSSAARLIRTGQLQQGEGDPETQFRDALCEYATVLVDCNEMLIEVIPMNSYADFSGPSFDENGNFVPQGFDAGGSNQKVLIRVAFEYSMMTPMIGPIMNGPDGGTLFISTIVMQSEPYEFQGS
ncbi:MAG: pilus assembly protein [Alphaproteobacteria bacterium]|nr:pilus assembly protein [Alphaproteobacteria bacterium]